MLYNNRGRQPTVTTNSNANGLAYFLSANFVSAHAMFEFVEDSSELQYTQVEQETFVNNLRTTHEAELKSNFVHGVFVGTVATVLLASVVAWFRSRAQKTGQNA
jgi:hypothetical protein